MNAKIFFNFSIKHHTDIDLVTMIDYIQVETKHSKIAYVGHSMGTTIMFRLAAENPAYVREKISTFIALGPTIVPTNLTSPLLKQVVKNQELIYTFFELARIYEFAKNTIFSSFILRLLCGHLINLCENVA